jgi:outer membrane scaffolding protein for murein synthesis (MipA/OmpV family)
MTFSSRVLPPSFVRLCLLATLSGASAAHAQTSPQDGALQAPAANATSATSATPPVASSTTPGAAAAPAANAAANPASVDKPDWAITLGAGVMVGPKYPGSNSMRFQPIPAIDIEYKNLLFAKEDMPLGVYFINTPVWSAGLALQYDNTQRRPSDNLALAGLGGVDTTYRAKLFGSYTLSALTLSSSAAQDIGGHAEGLLVDANAIVTLPVGTKWYLSAGPGLTWGNSQYQNAFFGVNPAQSVASGLAQYQAHAGLRDIYLSFEADYLITKHWTATATLKFAQLQGSASLSPVKQSHQQTTTSLALSYTF